MSKEFIDQKLDQRKEDHLFLAERAQHSTVKKPVNELFYYEPLSASMPDIPSSFLQYKTLNRPVFLPYLQRQIFGKNSSIPFWISSMTGGTKRALPLNQTLARSCRLFGIGMGLGSCRPLLSEWEKNKSGFAQCASFNDFNLRPVLGDEVALAANLGIAQIEKMIEQYGVCDTQNIIGEMLEALCADGLFVHINLLQEFLQPEGDMIKIPPLVTLEKFLEEIPFKVAVKEVGQGMGPESLEGLLQLPLELIEFAALGGTNFSTLEILRGGPKALNPLATIGHDAFEMLDFLTLKKEQLGDKVKVKTAVVSGGVTDFLEGYYALVRLERSGFNGLFGQAHTVINLALLGEDHLNQYLFQMIRGLSMAYNVLKIK